MSRSEKIIWFFFAAASLQLAFLMPSLPLVHGERTNLFSGLLCLAALVAAFVFRPKDSVDFKSPEVLISLGLTALALLSCLFSLTPLPSFYRVFVLLTSALGGFWCSRILLQSRENQRRFEKFCLVLFAGVVLMSLTGYLWGGRIEFFYHESNTHPLTSVILLLSFAPLTLFRLKTRPALISAMALLALGYAAICLSERLSVVFIPLGVCFFGALWGALKLKHLVLIGLLMAVVVGVFHQQIWWGKLSRAYPYYRIENFPFSWSIATEHPFFGIGVRSPRGEFLKDYHIKYPYVTKEKFAQDLKAIVSADNMLLTFLAGLGFPFTLLYVVAVGILMAKLIGRALKPAIPGLFFHPLALLFPLSVALVHFQLYDALLFAQVSWFFHILLGLIPVRSQTQEEEAVIPRESLSCSL